MGFMSNVCYNFRSVKNSQSRESSINFKPLTKIKLFKFVKLYISNRIWFIWWCLSQIEEATKFVNLFLFLRLENGAEGAVWSQRLFPKLKDFCPGQIHQARSTQSTLWIQKIHPGNKEELSSQVFSWVTSFCIIFF